MYSPLEASSEDGARALGESSSVRCLGPGAWRGASRPAADSPRCLEHRGFLSNADLLLRTNCCSLGTPFYMLLFWIGVLWLAFFGSLVIGSRRVDRGSGAFVLGDAVTELKNEGSLWGTAPSWLMLIFGSLWTHFVCSHGWWLALIWVCSDRVFWGHIETSTMDSAMAVDGNGCVFSLMKALLWMITWFSAFYWSQNPHT